MTTPGVNDTVRTLALLQGFPSRVGAAITASPEDKLRQLRGIRADLSFCVAIITDEVDRLEARNR